MVYDRVKKYCRCALFAAVIALLSQITLPLAPVPVNLALVGVWSGAAILGHKYGTVSVLIYLAVGLMGLPVFAGFQGGFGAFLGPTGGFLFAYPLVSLITGAITNGSSPHFWRYPVSMAAGGILCYICGTAWYALSYGTNLYSALTVCVLPFIISDAAKIALASFISFRIRKSGILK